MSACLSDVRRSAAVERATTGRVAVRARVPPVRLRHRSHGHDAAAGERDTFVLELLQTESRRTCIQSCLQRRPQCAAAILIRTFATDTLQCELHTHNSETDANIRLQPLDAANATVIDKTVFEVLTKCPKQQPVEQLANDDADTSATDETRWSAWTECSKRCGGGETKRTRQTNEEQVKTCNTQPCHVARLAVQDGGQNYAQPQTNGAAATAPKPQVQAAWSEWGAWGQCTVSCGQGVQTRQRQCSTPGYCGQGAFQPSIHTSAQETRPRKSRARPARVPSGRRGARGRRAAPRAARAATRARAPAAAAAQATRRAIAPVRRARRRRVRRQLVHNGRWWLNDNSRGVVQAVLVGLLALLGVVWPRRVVAYAHV